MRDLINDKRFEIRARHFVNAAGPWVDDIRRLDDPAARRACGSPRACIWSFRCEALPVNEPLVLRDDENRIVFVMPHDRYVLVGTTDTDFSGDRRTVAADPSDIEYLLRVLAEGLPNIKLTRDDIVSSFAGLRALVISGDEKSPSAVPREETILESASGMLSVAGGKLTTHREIAEKVVDRVMKELGRSAGARPTGHEPLPGARALDGGDDSYAAFSWRQSAIPRGSLWNRAALVARIAAERPELAEPLAPDVPRSAPKSFTRFATRWHNGRGFPGAAHRARLALSDRGGSRGARGRAHHGRGIGLGRGAPGSRAFPDSSADLKRRRAA